MGLCYFLSLWPKHVLQDIIISHYNQAECEELQARVERLATENSNLRDELQRLSEECEKLTAANISIKV